MHFAYAAAARDHEVFAFAGLWERWRPREGAPIDSFAILTTKPNALVAKLHDRMPVILHAEDHARWLDRQLPPTAVEALLGPYPEAEMIAVRVSARVNNVANDEPSCVAAVGDDGPKQGSLF